MKAKRAANLAVREDKERRAQEERKTDANSAKVPAHFPFP
jgi:hypothetical protein